MKCLPLLLALAVIFVMCTESASADEKDKEKDVGPGTTLKPAEKKVRALEDTKKTTQAPPGKPVIPDKADKEEPKHKGKVDREGRRFRFRSRLSPDRPVG